MRVVASYANPIRKCQATAQPKKLKEANCCVDIISKFAERIARHQHCRLLGWIHHQLQLIGEFFTIPPPREPPDRQRGTIIFVSEGELRRPIVIFQNAYIKPPFFSHGEMSSVREGDEEHSARHKLSEKLRDISCINHNAIIYSSEVDDIIQEESSPSKPRCTLVCEGEEITMEKTTRSASDDKNEEPTFGVSQLICVDNSMIYLSCKFAAATEASAANQASVTIRSTVMNGCES